METTGSSKSQSATSQRFEQFINNDNGEDHAFDRLQSVVSHLGTNVLIADSERNLVYMNERSEETLRAVEDVIKDELGLSVDELMGGSIDRFHGNRKNEIAKTLSNPKNCPSW